MGKKNKAKKIRVLKINIKSVECLETFDQIASHRHSNSPVNMQDLMLPLKYYIKNSGHIRRCVPGRYKAGLTCT